jgi:hypothetical protein
MSSTNANALTNPAVSASGEVNTLLIEKFNGTVHLEYGKGENLLGRYEVQEVVGTNMVSNKYLGGTEVHRMVQGTEPEASPTSTDKNALVVDTMILARNTVAHLHDVQNDFETKNRLAKNQVVKLKQVEDQMVLQQNLTGALTGGLYDGDTITGGIKRIDNTDHGVAIKMEITPAQAKDPIALGSAIELVIEGLIIQRTPISNLSVIVPIQEYGRLVDYQFIAKQQGGQNEAIGLDMEVMSGSWSTYGISVTGSTEFTQMRIAPKLDKDGHHPLSTADNGFRYDVSADMKLANAIVTGRDALLCGRTISLSTDIFKDKKSKTFYIDSWLAEGAIPDRYDNMGAVFQTAGVENAAVKLKADGKAVVTRALA